MQAKMQAEEQSSEQHGDNKAFEQHEKHQAGAASDAASDTKQQEFSMPITHWTPWTPGPIQIKREKWMSSTKMQCLTAQMPHPLLMMIRVIMAVMMMAVMMTRVLGGASDSHIQAMK